MSKDIDKIRGSSLESSGGGSKVVPFVAGAGTMLAVVTVGGTAVAVAGMALAVAIKLVILSVILATIYGGYKVYKVVK